MGFAGGLVGLLVICMFGSRITSFEIFGYFWILAAIVVRANALEGAAYLARAGARRPVVAPWVAGVPVVVNGRAPLGEEQCASRTS